MKRNSLIKHLSRYGAYLIRQGKRHSIYQRGEFKTEVPRHTEIVDELRPFNNLPFCHAGLDPASRRF